MTVSECWLIKLLPYILFEKYIRILALELASPGNQHRADCIDTLSFALCCQVLHWASTLHIPNVNNLRPTTRDLITRLLCDQRRRLGRRGGAAELQRHAYFDGVQFDDIRRRPAPYVPAVAHPADTSNFDVAEPVAPQRSGSSPAGRGGGGDTAGSETADAAGHHAFLEFTFRRFFDDDDDARLMAARCSDDDDDDTAALHDALYV